MPGVNAHRDLSSIFFPALLARCGSVGRNTRLTICVAALRVEGRSVGCPDLALHAPGRPNGSVGRAARPNFFFAALRAAGRSVG